jgi:hypothetical protein
MADQVRVHQNSSSSNKSEFRSSSRKGAALEKQTRPAAENLRDLRQTIFLAKEMGEGLGRREILFRSLPQLTHRKAG